MLVRHLSGRQKRLEATNPQLKFIKKGQPAETSPAKAAPSIRQLKNPPFAEDKPRPNTVARSFGRMRRPLCHHARMGIILSHTTARAVYQTANSLASYAIGPIPMEKIRVSAPTTSDLEAARAWLNRKNVDSERIHVLTFSNNAKRHRKGCICHCTRYTFDAESYLELEPNVYIVDIKLCALEATADLNLSELVEYYFEICGSYALGTSDETQYRERPALTSVEELRAFFSEAPGYRGSNKALKALSYVHEGCRSPLETAFVMMLTMPKSMGGLAIRAIKTDYPIPVPKRYAALTRRTVFYLDALLENSMTVSNTTAFTTTNPSSNQLTRSAETRCETWDMPLSRLIVIRFSSSPLLNGSWKRFAFARRYGPVDSRITSPSCKKLFVNLSCGATSNTVAASWRHSKKKRPPSAKLQANIRKLMTRASTMCPNPTTCNTSGPLLRKSMGLGNATCSQKSMKTARKTTRLLI